MYRAALAALAATLFLAACQDVTTTTASVVRDDYPAMLGGFSGDNPPPPPIDSGAVGTAQDTQNQSNFSTAEFNVTYFLNKPENSGWLKFNRDAYDNTDVDNSAAIRMTAGVYSGKGVIRLFAEGGTFIIDLSKANFDGTSFQDCGATTPAADGAGSCFTANLGGAGVTFKTKEGSIHQASVQLRPQFRRTDSCIGTSSEACIITSGN